MELNHKVSNAEMDIEYKKRTEAKHFQNTEEVYQFSNPYKDYAHFLPKSVVSKYKTVPVRTQPKIGRNEICPKCESGLKFKRCCGVSK